MELIYIYIYIYIYIKIKCFSVKLQYFCPGGKLILTQKLLELHKKLIVGKQSNLF